MILDKILLSKIHIVAKTLLNRSNLKDYPHNINEMKVFLNTLKDSINRNEFEGVLIANILFSFVSDKDVRDRKTTSRTFEDIFSSLFSQTSSDTKMRTNPQSIPEIISLDSLCDNENWKISSDLSGNKREKADLFLGDYAISLKTLKGPIIGPNNIVLDPKLNEELNVGSLSYRALLKGILYDEEIIQLSDRKGGLGSGKQLRKNIFNPILKKSKQHEFLHRLKLFLSYIYEEDIYIVLKSHYRIDFYLIPNSSFIRSITYIYERSEPNFEKIFYRWENNNLRLRWKNMLLAMDKYQLPYYKILINLENSFHNQSLQNLHDHLGKQIEEYINRNLNKVN